MYMYLFSYELLSFGSSYLSSFVYVCRTILKVGNQINDGESNMGFTMDSLLKLNTSKAFDKKTSVLQYVITLLFRNDLDALLFTEDLKSVVEVNTHTYIHT